MDGQNRNTPENVEKIKGQVRSRFFPTITCLIIAFALIWLYQSVTGNSSRFIFVAKIFCLGAVFGHIVAPFVLFRCADQRKQHR